MALTNAYCTTDQLAEELGQVDGLDDTKMEIAINAASRQIDGYCDRRFWQDSAVATRQYYADSATCCFTDDISTTTGLIVAVDTDLTGTYELTLTINTDFIVAPVNAADEVPVRPYTELLIIPNGATYWPRGYNRPGVQVTAKFGWPAVPDDIEKACLIQSAQLFKAKDAAFGVVSFGETGAASFVRASLNPLARALVDPYAHPSVG